MNSDNKDHAFDGYSSVNNYLNDVDDLLLDEYIDSSEQDLLAEE
jgi:hypothetical protein